MSSANKTLDALHFRTKNSGIWKVSSFVQWQTENSGEKEKECGREK